MMYRRLADGERSAPGVTASVVAALETVHARRVNRPVVTCKIPVPILAYRSDSAPRSPKQTFGLHHMVLHPAASASPPPAAEAGADITPGCALADTGSELRSGLYAKMLLTSSPPPPPPPKKLIMATLPANKYKRCRFAAGVCSGGSRIFARGVRQLVPLECPKPLHALSPSDP